MRRSQNVLSCPPRHVPVLLAALACGAASCAADDPPAPIATVQSGLSAVDQCVTTPADKTLTGGGVFKTNTNYAHIGTGCESAYLIDLNNYHTTYNLGTTIAYAAPPPTTEVECGRAKIRAYVWERLANNGKTLLGSKIATGRWTTDIRGTSRCETPAMVLEDVIPGYQANGTRDYRIATRAELNDPAVAGNVRKELAFATVRSLPPTSMDGLGMVGELRSELINTPAGSISTHVQAMWSRKGGYNVAVECRSTLLEKTLLTFGKGSLIKAGGPTATVNARIQSLTDMYNAICTPGGTVTAFQTALRAYLDSYISLWDALRVLYTPLLPPGTVPDGFITDLLARLRNEDLGLLVSRCNVAPETVLNYVYDGTIPPGTDASRLLLGSCSTSASQDATQVAGALGVGAAIGGRTPATARQEFMRCLAPPDLAGTPRDMCNDPRASGAPSPSEPDGKPDNVVNVEGACFTPRGECTPQEKQLAEMQLQLDEQRLALEKEQARLRALERQVNEAEQRRISDAQRDAAGQVTDDVNDLAKDVGGLNPVIGFLVNIYLDAEKLYKDTKEMFKPGEKHPACAPTSPGNIFCPPADNQMCNPEFGITAWYETGLGKGGRPIQKADRLQHCLCKMQDAQYAALAGGIPGILPPSAACPDAPDSLKQDCLTNPFGPNDGPRRECLQFLRPGPVDVDTWQAKICQAVRCPAGEASYVMKDGSCDCLRPDPVIGRPACPITAVGHCTEDNPAPCFCQPLDGGAAPNGADPACRFDTTVAGFPGSKDDWIFKDPTAAVLHQFDATNRLLMTRPGHTSLVTPNLYKNSFAQTGTTLRTDVLLATTPAVGQNVDLQLYCTNRGNNLINSYMGEVRLNTLTPGAIRSIDIPLNASTRSACLNGAFNFEFILNTPSSFTPRTGVGWWRFGGTLTATPAADLRPICPRPAPTNTVKLVDAINPVWTDLGGGATNPIPTWTFSSSLLGEIPRIISLPR